jgi:hypothetical protein
VYSGKLILAAMHLRRVGIGGSSYPAEPAKFSKVVTPPSPAEQNLGVRKGGKVTLLEQMIINSEAVQQERCSIVFMYTVPS